jgi:putative glycosyltransferase (TIGR04372 family)
VAPLWRYNRLIPGGEAHDVIMGMDQFEYAKRLLEETNVHLRFTEDEEDFGLKSLDQMGIQPDDEFICLHVRDGAYLAQEFPEGSWDYHDYRDASIENFLPAANALAEQGYFVIRMGATAKEPFGGEQTKVIDYSWDHRTDFMDIFLLSRCRFLLGTNSGVADVADIFRRPVLRTNMIQFWAEIPLCKSKDVFIPKKLWKKDEDRFLSFPELIDSDLWETHLSKQYSDAGVEPVENSPDEIVAAVDEMEARLNRTHRPEAEEEALQNRFWDLMRSRGVVSGPPHARIGSDFIVRNEALLS